MSLEGTPTGIPEIEILLVAVSICVLDGPPVGLAYNPADSPVHEVPPVAPFEGSKCGEILLVLARTHAP